MNMEKEKLLIIEDDSELSTQMKWGLAEAYQIFQAGDRLEALKILNDEQPPVVTLDLGLPPKPDGVEEGFRILGDILSRDTLAKVIVITGQNDKENALVAVGQGAYDFLPKPVKLEELRIILDRAFYVSRLEREHLDLKKRMDTNVFEKMLGTSPQMLKVFEMIQKVATTDASVLIRGESGTGKELAARAIHSRSTRREGPFVAIDCGAIPETLLESELFGHEKGAFTGAHIQRMGRIEAAQKGTLLLDEIGELSTHLQAKLLRFLQEQQIERVGGREAIPVDTRVLAATNRDLDQALKDGNFREDLYYRLGVVTISIPPLRERNGDVLLMAKAFLQRFSAENNKQSQTFTTQAVDAIQRHTWPGNIRELENRVKRAVIMAEGKKITPTDMELTVIGDGYKGRSLKDAREALEKDMVLQALERNKGHFTKTASDLGISRPGLYDLMERLGIEKGK
jgi:two-component system NtrC family response regulator